MRANLNEQSDVTNEGHVAQKTPKAEYSSMGQPFSTQEVGNPRPASAM